MNFRIFFTFFFLFCSNTFIVWESLASPSQAAKSNYFPDPERVKYFREYLEKNNLQNVNSQDEELYYFVLHDRNEDHHLDGHELREAFSEFHYESIEEIENYVDHVLGEDDLNNDGKISWVEYLGSQEKHK